MSITPAGAVHSPHGPDHRLTQCSRPARHLSRNTDTAETYNKLGLPEHHAMEAFVRYDNA